MKRIFFLITIFQLFTSLQAQYSVETQLDRDSIMIGEHFLYSVKMESEKTVFSVVPVFDDLKEAGLELIEYYNDSVKNDESITYSFNYVLTGFDSGVYEIPEMPLLVYTPDKVDSMKSKAMEINIFVPEVDTTAEIMDIKDPVKTPFNFEEIKPYLPYIGGGSALALLIVFLFLKFKRKKESSEEKILIPAHIKAIRSLDNIKEQKLWQKGQVKEYYVDLSDAIRLYIEDRYQIPALESVTWEILNKFKKYSYDDDLLMEILEDLLSLSDLVKFAKENPDPAENETHLNHAYIFIEKTKKTDDLQSDNTENVE